MFSRSTGEQLRDILEVFGRSVDRRRRHMEWWVWVLVVVVVVIIFRTKMKAWKAIQRKKQLESENSSGNE